MTKSESISKLAVAMIKAQTQLENIEPNKENPYFKSMYADLASIIDKSKPVLAKHGLVVIQTLNGTGDTVVVETTLLHESGEYIGNGVALKSKDMSPQALGSCVTYGRRYSLSAILGISTESDDDGNTSSKPQNDSHNVKEGAKPPVPATKPQEPVLHTVSPSELVGLAVGTKVAGVKGVIKNVTNKTNSKGEKYVIISVFGGTETVDIKLALEKTDMVVDDTVTIYDISISEFKGKKSYWGKRVEKEQSIPF